MAPPTKLAHVVYMTRRFDEMLSWYQKVFEARVQYQNPGFAAGSIQKRRCAGDAVGTTRWTTIADTGGARVLTR